MSNVQKFWISGFVFFSILFIYFLAPVLAPFLVAGLLAYLGDPLVERLQQLKLPRTAAVVIFFLVATVLAMLFLFMLIPMLQKQFAIFLEKLPDMIAWLQQTGLPWISDKVGIDKTIDIQTLKTTLVQNWQKAGSYAAVIWQTFSHSGAKIAGWVVNLLLIPVVTFYLLRDWPQIVAGLWILLPRRFVPLIRSLINECNKVLGAFFRGQLIVMLLLGLIYSIGLWAVGLQLALLIGMVIGLISIVPYLGVIVGLSIASIAALVQFHDWVHVGYVLIVFAIGHVIESMVLTPLLVGDRIGLHPVAVIFAILAGGTLFGFVGVLLALPIAAVIKVLWKYIRQQYLTSDLYQSLG